MIRAIGHYGLVSGTCLLLNNSFLIAFDYAGLPLWLNLAITTAIAIVVGYVLLSIFVFRSVMTWSGIARYSIVLIANMPIAYGLLWLLTSLLPMHFAAPMVTTLMLIWNAAGSTWAIRKRHGTAAS